MKAPSILKISLLLLLIMACIVVILLGWGLSELPRRAEQSFGPPSPDLSPVQRLRLSTQLLLQEDLLLQPSNISSGSIPFKITLGESTYQVTKRLQSEGLVKDAEALRNYLVYTGLDKTLQAGEYSLSPRMTAIEIAHALQDATPTEVSFNILPGWRMEEVAAALPTSGLSFSPDLFLDAARRPPNLSASAEPVPIPEGATLEGFIFPDNYRLPRDTTVNAFIQTVLDNFQIKVNYELREGFKNQGLSLFQAVILASIVQREAVLQEEMPTIASVFLNRLKANMRLDSDPTVQYALGYKWRWDNWWKTPLTLDDLQIDSVYNTYRYAGLPPGPISNPSLAALRAVAFPAQTPYLYFRAACDGSGKHNFAVTFEEHQQNACP
jgi:UPF0755 protein